MVKLSVVFCMMMLAALVASGGSFSQCPAVGADTLGCELLVTVSAVDVSGISTSFSVATASPDQGPYDGVEDTLIGIVNMSGSTLNAITFSGTAGGIPIFGFDGDGACAAIACVGGDSTGYGGPGVSFSAINPGQDSGTVNFAPGLADGTSAWFSLEGPITASILSGVPEPGSLAMLGLGLITLVGGSRLRRFRK